MTELARCFLIAITWITRGTVLSSIDAVQLGKCKREPIPVPLKIMYSRHHNTLNKTVD